MLSPKKEAYASRANGIIKKLKERGMEGYYFDNSSSCVEKIQSMLPDKSVIGWGGSETLKECGMMDVLQAGDYTLLDRSEAKTPQESREVYAKTVMADYFFMSSNAITLDGELVNIDGIGNRVACLIHGPAHIILIVGMNKVVENAEIAVSRIRNTASPSNAKRLDRQTPCGVNGKCGNCLSPSCMCNQIVITRHCGIEGRIKVFLVGEELGY